jgi:hypothetical protein
MHGAVLQNKKYLEFSADNTVEVLALGGLDEGIQKEDAKAATYDATDEDGNPVKYMVSWPNLTSDEIMKLSQSKAASYNDTGGIPYTCIVNPHTEEKMHFWSGGQSSKSIMEVVELQKRALNEKYGPSVKRSDLAKFSEDAKDTRTMLAEKGVAKALPELASLLKKWGSKGKVFEERSKILEDEVMLKAGEELDAIEAKIEAGDLADAKKALTPLARALKKTGLEERANALLERTKAE